MSSATYSAIAASQAAIASQHAEEAKRERCATLVQGYSHDAATVEQMQSYAECVGTLYPDPLTQGEIYILKSVFVIALIGMLIGGIRAARQGEDLAGVVMFSIVGFVLGPLAVLCVVGLIGGVIWLVT